MPSPRLILASQTPANPDITIDLPENGDWFVIGSSPECNSCILDLSVGKKHCQIRYYNNVIQIQTLDFGIGTWINNAPIDDIVPLKQNDTVGIGDLLFKANLQNEPKSGADAHVGEKGTPPPPPPPVLQNELPSAVDVSSTEHPSAPPTPNLQNEPKKPIKPPSYLRSPYSRPGSMSRSAPMAPPNPNLQNKPTSGAGVPTGGQEPVLQNEPKVQPTPSSADPRSTPSPVLQNEPTSSSPLLSSVSSAYPQYASKHTPQSLADLINSAQSNAQKLGFFSSDEIQQFCQCALLCNDDLAESNSVNSDVWLTLTLQGKPAPMRLKRALSIAQRIAETRYSSPISTTPKPVQAPKPVQNEAKPAPAPAKVAPSSEFPVIEGFEFKRLITHGAMGDVYEAHDTTLDVPVAVKFLHGMIGPTMERFLSEARAAAKVQHPNLVPVRSFGQTPHGCYYVMPFINGMDGDQLVEAFKAASAPSRSGVDILIAAGIKPNSASTEIQQALSHPQPYYALICSWIAMAAEGLERAHAAGVIHRDIKPGNLMLDNDGRMMITDFGLALRFDERFTAGCVGTPRYLSPEMLAAWAAGSAGADLDERMDIWGLGLCLIELLTLRAPYEGSIDKIFRDMATLDAPRPRQIIPDIPESLDEICAKACQRNPAKRYAHAIELAVDLRGAFSAHPQNGNTDEKSSGIFGWLRKK